MTKENWEKEFEKEFGNWRLINKVYITDVPEIKDFISNQIAQAKKEERERIEKIIHQEYEEMADREGNIDILNVGNIIKSGVLKRIQQALKDK